MDAEYLLNFAKQSGVEFKNDIRESKEEITKILFSLKESGIDVLSFFIVGLFFILLVSLFCLFVRFWFHLFVLVCIRFGFFLSFFVCLCV